MAKIRPPPPPAPDPERYRVVGPMTQTGNLCIMDGDRCVATIKHDAAQAAECRRRAERMARAEPRTFILKHLLAEMESDESRWTNELQMVRDELSKSSDLENT